MRYLYICAYDTINKIYGEPMRFDDEKLAVASLRRNIRDMFESGEISLEQVVETEFRIVAQFDTESGIFYNIDDDEYNKMLPVNWLDLE